MSHLYSRTIDYCPDDSVQIIPKHRRDYVPDGCDPMTLAPLPQPDKPTPEAPKAPHEPSTTMTFEPVTNEDGSAPSPIGFKCDKCDFETKNEQGMKTHVTKKHAKE